MSTDPHQDSLASELQVFLRVDLDHRINYAMQQNDVPIVKVLHVENRGDEPLRDVGIRITADPEFAAEWTTRISLISERATYNVEAIDLALSSQYLGMLTERVAGHLWFGVTQGNEVLLRHSRPVELLARDEWSGLGSLPEILAAFVLPNHPAVEDLLSEAARILGGWTGDPSLSGYQSRDPKCCPPSPQAADQRADR